MTTRPCIVLALLAASFLPLTAIERRPLPQFSIVALDGAVAASDSLISEEKWLLVYVQRACSPCDGLLRSIESSEQGVAGRLTVVVGGTDAAGAARVAASYPRLATARWYADPNRTMAKALPLAGAPVVFGLKGKMLEWSRAGLTPSAASVTNAMTSWAGAVKAQ